MSAIDFIIRPREGELLHQDSLDCTQLIRPGEVNWMTAGKGIAHSERAVYLVDGDLTIDGERLERAKQDWKLGRFATVPGETEFIPLPES